MTANAAADAGADLGTSSPRSAFTVDPAALERHARRMKNPLLMRIFLLWKLPLGFMAGLRVKHLDPSRCQTTVPYGWRTQNPFRSTYFAAQSMAAELSTGAIAMAATEMAPASVAMLITGLKAEFGKKATATTTFTCDQGEQIFAAVARTMETGEPEQVTVETVGRMPDGTEVSRFQFTWSFKRRASRAA
ncbi:MAG: DUF4442 domain-containing protein [Holophagales bacterium]|nr:DUF4442 domain-containing protein [Holophagales bacterium]